MPNTKKLTDDELEVFLSTLDEPGVITSGLCATPEAQAEFDANQAGKPPLDTDVKAS